MAHELLSGVDERDWGRLLLERGADAFVGRLGIEAVDIGGGSVTGRLPVTQDVMATNGLVHAGAIVSLADTVAAYGCLATAPSDVVTFATVDVGCSFLASAGPGDTLVAHAGADHLGAEMQVWSVQVTRASDRRSVALFRCTQLLRRDGG